MNVCSRLECQTSAGCAHRGPHAQMCYFPADLSSYTDEQIAAEHHWRMMKKLGDPRICVSGPKQIAWPEYLALKD